MKKSVIIAQLLCCVALLYSCGGGNQGKCKINEISKSYDDMTSTFNEFVTVESDECVIECGSLDVSSTSLVLKKYSLDADELSKISDGTISLMLLDKDDVEIGEMELANRLEMFEWLKTAESLAKKEFTFKGNVPKDLLPKIKEIKWRYKDNSTQSLNNATNEMLSAGTEEVNDDSNIDNVDNDAVSEAGSEDWDELLNSYEEYVDKYISYVKKAAKGDMSALSEYPALMDKAKEFSEKMENAQSDMSASQWARYLKITNKMTKAAAEMQ